MSTPPPIASAELAPADLAEAAPAAPARTVTARTRPLPAELQRLLDAEPDLVDRIFDYIFSDPQLAQAITAIGVQSGQKISQLKTAVRAEFRGEECYIAGRPATERQRTVARVLALFNGRNATEVARQLGIGRTTVYRYLKQARGG